MVLIPILLSLALAGPEAQIATDPLLDGEGGVCLATGYCRTPGQGAAPPGGIMYLAIGLVGGGVTALRHRRAA